MNSSTPQERQNGDGFAWYDLICPFCYVGQARTQILIKAGLRIVELPFEAHPDTPIEGTALAQREGPIYALLEREARNAGLELNWPANLPNSRLALTAAEWARRSQPANFCDVKRRLFEAHFVLGEDLGDPALVDRKLAAAGIDPGIFWVAVDDGSAEDLMIEARGIAHGFGIHAVPAWFVSGTLISGLHEEADYKELTARQQDILV